MRTGDHTIGLMKYRAGLWARKLIGVALFALIITHIDTHALIRVFAEADAWLLGISFPVVFVIYYCRTHRWKTLVHAGGLALPFRKHWNIMNVGIFLACILPGKIG